jgi:hypothetical protein
MKPLKNFLSASLILLAGLAFGQKPATGFTSAAPNVQNTLTTYFTPANTTGISIGDTVAVQLHVSGFANIISLQFPIYYNSSMFEFAGIDAPALPGFVDTLPINHPTPGSVVVSWFPNPLIYPNGFSMNDNERILTLVFKVIGAGTSQINVGTPYPVIEVYSYPDVPVTLNYQAGAATFAVSSAAALNCNSSGNPPAAPVYSGFKVITNSIYIPQGEVGCMPVTVNDFDNIVTVLFALHWDPTVFKFDCFRGFNLPDLALKVNNVAPNTAVVGWDDPSASGVTRADGSKMFEICFKAIGQPSAQSIILMDGNILAAGTGNNPEAYNAASQNLWTNNTPVKDTIFVTDPNGPQCPVTFSADKDSVVAGTQTCLDIKAENFFWMTNAEFSLNYDPAFATFKQIQLGSNPLNLKTTGAQSNFEMTTGAIHFNWKNNTAINGVTLDDQTTLFSACFQSFETPGIATHINFGSGHCLGIGAARKNIGGVPMLTKDGAILTKKSEFIIKTDTVIIVYGNRIGHKTDTGTGTATNGVFANLQAVIYPNPFTESATVEFTLAESEDVEILIFDPIGRIVYKKSAELLPPGKHGMKIDKDMLPEKGIYYLTIRTTTQNAVQTFLKF